MDKQQAKFILQSYQPGSAAPHDAQIAEALAEVANDAELRQWFVAEQNFDAILRDKLAGVRPPSHLRAQLLAASPEPLTTSGIFWRPWLALAASVVFLLGLVWWKSYAHSQPTFPGYRSHMVATLYQPLTFEFRSAEPAALQAWVSTNSSLGILRVPSALTSLPGLGCRTLDWNGRPAVVLCFLVSERTAVHLFVMSGRGIKHRLSSQVQVAAVGSFQTASWAEGDLIYMLAGSGDAASLRRLLGNTGPFGVQALACLWPRKKC